MTILINRDTKVIVQGITGREGSFHTKSMLEYGTKIVAGVTPGKGGEQVYEVPVYDSVEDAKKEHPEASASIVFVPARFAADAVYEAIEAKLNPIVVITEHIPVHETLRFVEVAKREGIIIVGPNCPGVIVPGQIKLGIMPSHIFKPGKVGIVSRSGTLTYEIAHAISREGLGQSICIGVGGDPITGINLVEAVKLLEKDPDTEAIVVIGEIGGDIEERLATYIKESGEKKPIVAFIAGRTAPPGKRMGHAGAIISMGVGTAEAKIRAFKDAGVEVAEKPSDVPKILRELL